MKTYSIIFFHLSYKRYLERVSYFHKCTLFSDEPVVCGDLSRSSAGTGCINKNSKQYMEGTEITFWFWDIDIGDRGWEKGNTE